jgi:hypothetical protein
MRDDILDIIILSDKIKPYRDVFENRIHIFHIVEHIFHNLGFSALPKDKSHALRMLSEKTILDALLERKEGARFRSHPVARKTMLRLMETLASSVEFATPEDEQRMRTFVEYATQNNLHMVELRAHFNHMDAPTQLLLLSALQGMGIYPPNYIENLLC